jgi:hypothetical protein
MAARKRRAVKVEERSEPVDVTIEPPGSFERPREKKPAKPDDPLAPLKAGPTPLRNTSPEKLEKLRQILTHMVRGEQIPFELRSDIDYKIHNARRVRAIRTLMGRQRATMADARGFVEAMLFIPEGE